MSPPWQALASGAELFNRGQYWEAHEAWEELWLELDDQEKLFVQGLIQGATKYNEFVGGEVITIQGQPAVSHIWDWSMNRVGASCS